MNTNKINLIYVRDKISYEIGIDRILFLDQMQRFAIWQSPDNNHSDAQKICKLIPELETIRINYDIIETQDVPFFEYTTYSNVEASVFKLKRPCKTIWEILQFYCKKAVSAK